MKPCTVATLLTAALSASTTPALAQDALPSCNDTAPKKAVVAFVDRVTRAGSPDFVPAPERIAVFDNDGTLWSEQPVYTQLFFVVDRVRALAPQHIGRRPIAAFGNSDGDQQMLEWTTAGGGARFGLVVHHTDARARRWTVVSMKDDWKQIFPR